MPGEGDGGKLSQRERESQPYFLFQISIPNDILSVQHSLNVLGMYNE